MSGDALYRDLQRHLDRMPIPFPATQSGVEIRILRRLFSPEDARIALCLSAMPERPAVIHRRIKGQMSREALGVALDSMAERSLIQRYPGKGGPQYGKLMFVVGIYEGQLNRLTPELERDVREYFDEALGKELHRKDRSPQMRVVPVNRTIIPERAVARYDDIREVMLGSEGPFAAMPCICRQGKGLTGEPCKQSRTEENCLTIGIAAKAMVSRGLARSLTKEEMLAKLDLADREGLVLEPQNAQDPIFVCCCCGCCCGVLTTAKKLPRPAEFFGSTYRVAVDAAACQACGTCETRCQMEAVTQHAGATKVDDARCIGCGLCVSTCPSGALRLEPRDHVKAPPSDTGALYAQIFRERYGPWGIAQMVGRKALGMKF
jgi:Fe-S-cluster-containing hydrogenase component 2